MRMRSCRVARATDCLCKVATVLGSIPASSEALYHTRIWGATDEAVLNKVQKKLWTNQRESKKSMGQIVFALPIFMGWIVHLETNYQTVVYTEASSNLSRAVTLHQLTHTHTDPDNDNFGYFSHTTVLASFSCNTVNYPLDPHFLRTEMLNQQTESPINFNFFQFYDLKTFPLVIFVNGQKCVMRLDPDTNLDQILTLSRSYQEGALESLFDRNSDKCPGSLEQNTCTHRSHTDFVGTAGYRWIFVQEI